MAAPPPALMGPRVMLGNHLGEKMLDPGVVHVARVSELGCAQGIDGLVSGVSTIAAAIPLPVGKSLRFTTSRCLSKFPTSILTITKRASMRPDVRPCNVLSSSRPSLHQFAR